MSMLNRLIENLFRVDAIKKEALFHCADEMVREAVGRILEIGLYRQNVQYPRALNASYLLQFLLGLF